MLCPKLLISMGFSSNLPIPRLLFFYSYSYSILIVIHFLLSIKIDSLLPWWVLLYRLN